MVFIRIIIFLFALILGFAIIKWTDKIVQNVGRQAWVEQKFGIGSSYMMWKLIGIAIMIFGFLMLFYGDIIGI